MTYPSDPHQPPNPYQPSQSGPPGSPSNPGYPQPLPGKKKSHLGLIIGLVAAVLVLCCGGGIFAVASSKPKPVALSGPATTTGPAAPTSPEATATTQPPVPTAAAATTTQPAPPPPPPITDAAPPAPKTLLTVKGNGIKKSAIFKTSDEWALNYTFNCSSFAGGTGNFQVYEYTDGSLSNVLVNELAKKGTDSTPQHSDPGSHYLEMNSECSWTITVLG